MAALAWNEIKTPIDPLCHASGSRINSTRGAIRQRFSVALEGAIGGNNA
jgi:hypothetical protein